MVAILEIDDTPMFIDELTNDERLNFLGEVTALIDGRLSAISAKIDAGGYYDEDYSREDVEPMLGLGLVAFQIYGAATVADLKKRIVLSGKPKPNGHFKGFEYKCYSQDQFLVNGPKVEGQITGMQLLNAAANYFKHHDGWDQWPPTHPEGAKAAELLKRAGITKATESPCIEAVTLLCGTCWKMFDLHARVKQWRADIIDVFTTRGRNRK
jgi:hypothetical protein